jgi:hypothetical protein
VSALVVDGVSVVADVSFVAVVPVDGSVVVVLSAALAFAARPAADSTPSPVSIRASVEGVITRRSSPFDRTCSIVSRNADVLTRSLSAPTVWYIIAST